jgi:glycosyltransferase involved in cell wall biosynthesis
MLNTPILFSVVVCMYNEEKWIKQSIESLLAQSFDKHQYEIIVVDDESNDNCTQIVETIIAENSGQQPKLRLIRIEHGGLSIARNTGIREASGEYLLFLDGDAIADENWIENYHYTFKNTGCDYSSGTINLLNTESDFANLLHTTRFKQTFKKHGTQNFLHGVNMAFKADVFKEFKGFYENFESRGDDTSFSLLIRNFKVWAPSQDSIVLHERPESFKEWFGIYRKELMFSMLVYKVVQKNNKKASMKFLVPLFKSLITEFLLVLSILYWPMSVVLIFCVLFFKRAYLLKSYGGVKAYCFAVFIQFIDLFIRGIYMCFSFLKYRNVALSAPHSSPKKILIDKATV